MTTGSTSCSSILIVDDEKSVRESLRMALQEGYELHFAANGQEALRLFQTRAIDIVLLDIMLPDMNGIDLLKKFKQIDRALRVIMVTAVKEIQTAVDAMKAGAFDYLLKPFDIEHVRALAERALEQKKLQREIVYLNREIGRCRPFESMVGQGASMRKVFELIESVSQCEATVMIQGESGTGKELVARAVHNQSVGAGKPFVVINCGTIPATLMESELFGHRKGAFTGAFIDCPGKIEIAHTGSLFFDDIDSLSMEMQAKLLRLIQQKEFERLGSHRLIKVDIRIIAASNRDLKALVDACQFREDLYYRINVLPIDLPPLRQRGDDIGLLLDHFLRLHARTSGAPRKQFSPQARSMLMAYDWPGNVRELENLVERLGTLHKGRSIRAADLPDLQTRTGPRPPRVHNLKKATRAFERQYILDILEEVKGSRMEAARRLGIHRNTLLTKTRELGIIFRNM
ncbi:MAG: sigma-54-dependent Fis family transcriptional regulator [Desulfosarcina sp.]|nr:sigma-54-dependent Fis family transcriptional regulator [Desulfobacterales bacterium]